MALVCHTTADNRRNHMWWAHTIKSAGTFTAGHKLQLLHTHTMHSAQEEETRARVDVLADTETQRDTMGCVLRVISHRNCI